MTGTTRIPATAAATLAVDIGGANTKAAWLDGESLRTVSRPFEVWRDRAALSAVLRDVAAEVASGPAHAVAITMTAELSDAFRTKREGVAFVLDAAQDALGTRPLRVLTTAGAPVGRRRRQLGGDGARGGRRAPRRAAHRCRQHDRRPRPDRRGTRRRDRAQRPRAVAGRRARLHRRAAHQPRGDRAARAGPRRSLPGVV